MTMIQKWWVNRFGMTFTSIKTMDRAINMEMMRRRFLVLFVIDTVFFGRNYTNFYVS